MFQPYFCLTLPFICLLWNWNYMYEHFCSTLNFPPELPVIRDRAANLLFLNIPVDLEANCSSYILLFLEFSEPSIWDIILESFQGKPGPAKLSTMLLPIFLNFRIVKQISCMILKNSYKHRTIRCNEGIKSKSKIVTNTIVYSVLCIQITV